MLGTSSKNRLRPDYAIMTRIKQEEKFLDAQNYDRQLKNTGVIVKWDINQTKNESKNKKILNDRKIKSELMFTNQEIKIRRREKLSDLYLTESERYEEELNKRGLAIAKERY